MVAQPRTTMDDFVHNLLRDRQGRRSSLRTLYEEEDLESSCSTLQSTKVELVPDNARAHLPTNGSDTSLDERVQQPAEQWIASIPKKALLQPQDRWGTSGDAGLTMPERQPMSPYVKATAFRPSFDMSFLELSQEFSILSLERALEKDSDDYDDSSSVDSSSYLDNEESDEFALAGTKTEKD